MDHLITLAKRLLAYPPIARGFSHGASCLMYHRVIADYGEPSPFGPNIGLGVRVSDFEEQMRFVAEQFEPISLPEAIQRLKSGCLDRNAVVVTFDDGYEDNLSIALPILRKYNVPATIYVTTDAPEGLPFLWWYELECLMASLPKGKLTTSGLNISWSEPGEKLHCFNQLNAVMKVSTSEEQRGILNQLLDQGANSKHDSQPKMLTWNQIRELDDEPLITLGCHTQHHHPMTQLTPDELEKDLSASKALLEQKLEHPILHFAYPYGKREEATAREFEAVRQAGFVSAVTTRFGHWRSEHRTSLHSLPRITVTWHDSLQEFQMKLFGVRATLAQRGWRTVTD